MDAMVHILYEVAGTTGAFTSATLIGKFGYNYSSFMSPVLFFLAALSWAFISDVQEENRAAAVGIETTALEEFERGDVDANTGYMKAVWRGARGFVKATYFGAKIVFSARKYVWLVTGYSVALYGEERKSAIRFELDSHRPCLTTRQRTDTSRTASLPYSPSRSLACRPTRKSSWAVPTLVNFSAHSPSSS
jgi:hypothetical protein